MIMFGWFRRKPGFAEFAASPRARLIRKSLKAANPKMRPPEGFEHTVAERAKPIFAAEIAGSQSLKSNRKPSRDGRASQVSFGGGRK